MTDTALSRHHWLPILALFLLLITALVPRAALAQAGQQELDTKYFNIYYPAGEEQTAQWYASFVDETDEAVSELLGAAPVAGIELTIYDTEADYARANPIAEVEPGVMAHALPEDKQVGVAVERLRQVAPELARESFRHEMTHVVAGALSNQTLPIGFQEGLAQYNELSSSRAQEVVAALQDAQSNNQAIPGWRDLNDRREFRMHMDVAYPASYTMMAFLADRYGMGDYAHFLARLDKGDSWQDALFIGFGRKIDDLEQEWRDWLPSFLKDGWQTNVLSAYDLAPAQALYAAGHFAEARDGFTRSERLYRDLGRTAKAAEAAGLRDKADRGQKATAMTAQARTELEAHDYSAAANDATQAGKLFADLQLPAFKTSADQTATLAQDGLNAVAALDDARNRARLLDFGGAATAAHTAGETFARLGDQAHVDEANEMLAGLVGWQRLIALVVLGLGLLALLGGVIAVLFTLRRRREKPVSAYLREENATWL